MAPGPLSVDAIVAAAEAAVSGSGVTALSMRGLAKRFDVTPMAIYHHVGSRDDLLLLVLARVSAELRRPRLPRDPRRRAEVVATCLHEFVVSRPWVIDLIAGGAYVSEAGLWVPENLLRAGRDAGLAEQEAFAAYRAVLHLVLGSARALTARRTDDGGSTAARAVAGADPERFPMLAAAAGGWEELDQTDRFEWELGVLASALYEPRSGRGGTR